MKKWKIIGIAVFVIALVVLSFTVSSNKKGTSVNTSASESDKIVQNAQTEAASITEDEEKDPIYIDVSTYLDYREDSTPRIILIERPTCGYCQIAEPIINNIAYEYDLDIHYLNTDDFTDEDFTSLVESDEKFTSFGTPYLFIVHDGEIVAEVDGLTDHDHYIYFFQENGFIE